MNWSLNHNAAPTVVTIDQWLGLKASKVLNPPQFPQCKPALSLMKSLRQPPGMSEYYCIPQEEFGGGGWGGAPNLKEELTFFYLSPAAPQTEVA